MRWRQRAANPNRASWSPEAASEPTCNSHLPRVILSWPRLHHPIAGPSGPELSTSPLTLPSNWITGVIVLSLQGSKVQGRVIAFPRAHPPTHPSGAEWERGKISGGPKDSFHGWHDWWGRRLPGILPAQRPTRSCWHCGWKHAMQLVSNKSGWPLLEKPPGHPGSKACIWAFNGELHCWLVKWAKSRWNWRGKCQHALAVRRVGQRWSCSHWECLFLEVFQGFGSFPPPLVWTSAAPRNHKTLERAGGLDQIWPCHCQSPIHKGKPRSVPRAPPGAVSGAPRGVMAGFPLEKLPASENQDLVFWT